MSRFIRLRSWLFFLWIAGIALVPMEALAAPLSATNKPGQDPKQFLAEHPVWRVGGDPYWRPFCFRGADGKLIGLDIELSKVLADRIGVRIEWVDVPTWEEALRRFRSGEIDLLMGTAQTPERDQEMLFTSSYASSPVAVITRTDAAFLVTISELKGKTIAVPEAHVTTEYLRKLPLDFNLLTYPGLDEAARAVSDGRAEALVAGLVPAATSIKAQGLDNLKVGGLVDVRFDLKVAVRKDWPQARALLEKAISEDPPEVRIERFDRWLQPILGLQRQALRWRMLYLTGLSITGALMLVMLAVTLWNRMLKRQVKRATEKVRQEMAAREESELRFRTIFEKAPLGMFRSTPEGQFRSVNPFLAQLFEFDSPEHMIDEVNRKGIAESIFENPQQRSQIVESVREQVGGLFINNVRYRTRNGRTIETLLSMTAILDPADNRINLLGFVQDITAHTREEATRRQREKLLALGQMASGVAHDFNNLLCIILAETSLLAESQSNDPEASRAIHRIQASVESAVGLTSRLLRYLRAKGGEVAAVYDAHQAIRTASDLFRTAAGSSLIVQQFLEAPSSLIRGYQTDVQNVLLNLFLNARDAMGGTGTLAIRTRNLELDSPQCEAHRPESLQPGRYLEIRVIDSGPGMTEEVLANCRQPFFSTKGESGTGLGLWTAQGVIASAGGTMQIESSLGAGTTITVLIPLALPS